MMMVHLYQIRLVVLNQSLVLQVLGQLDLHHIQLMMVHLYQIRLFVLDQSLVFVLLV